MCSDVANLALVVPGRLLLAGLVKLATLQKRSSHVCSNSSVEEGLNSKCPKPTGPTLCPGPLTRQAKKGRKNLNIVENYDLKRLHLNVFVGQHIEF